MRRIIKQGEPQALQQWKAKNPAPLDNRHYDGVGFPKEEVRQALLAEQFHLCAYTMRKLEPVEECPQNSTIYSCHIEHFLPQSLHDHETSIDYANLLACYPPSASTVHCEYGAVAKKDYDPATQPFVSPLMRGVEQQFRFREDGSVEGLSDAAKTTIEILNLNAPALRNDRQAKIAGSLQPKGRKISASQARTLAKQIVQPQAGNKLPAFCIAIAQVLLRHAEKETARAARMRKQSK